MASGGERTDMRARRALAAVGICLLLTAAAMAQFPARTPAPASASRVATQPNYSRVEKVPQELLEDSRRSVILLPSTPGETGEDASDRSVGTRTRVTPDIPLLPEGYIVASREAQIAKEGDWFVARVARSANLPDSPPLRVLPNQQLAMLQAVMAQPSAPAGFLITGRITEFLGANYILVESIEEVISGASSDLAHEAATTAAEPETRPTNAPPGQEPTAEEILRQLLSRPTRRSVVLPQLTQVIAPEPPASSSAPSETSEQPRLLAAPLLPEHAMLVDRVGRVVPGEKWWSLVFENRGRDAADKPIRLLPSRLLESAISLSRGGTQSAIFLISGEITTYENNNYLLLRKVLLRRHVGNIR